MPSLYPFRFDPLFKPAIWGGRRLPMYLRRGHTDQPIGEAWVLSDVDGSPSRVTNGPRAGETLRELLAADPAGLLGTGKPVNGRFPLLLKFIDAARPLSVQVHPTDALARKTDPTAAGKTEAWVVLDADPHTSRIYAGFRPGVTADGFRRALATKTAPETLHQFTPSPGDCVFLPAGTVHAIGADLLVFEVQQTSDITYRLYDWDRIDEATGKGRELHVEAGLAAANFALGPCDPVTPAEVSPARQRLAACEYFTLHRLTADRPTKVGTPGRCTAVVCVAGGGRLGGEDIAVGDTFLLPAAVGTVELKPGGPITLLECGLPT